MKWTKEEMGGIVLLVETLEGMLFIKLKSIFFFKLKNFQFYFGKHDLLYKNYGSFNFTNFI